MIVDGGACAVGRYVGICTCRGILRAVVLLQSLQKTREHVKEKEPVAPVVDIDPVPPPPVEVLAPTKPPRGTHSRVEVPGGWLVMRPGNLNGHCSNPRHRHPDGHGCRASTTIKPANPEKTVRGNTGAWLLAWLEYGKTCTMEEHSNARGPIKYRSEDASTAMDLPKREPWREWLVEHRPSVCARERPKRGDDPIEQPIL